MTVLLGHRSESPSPAPDDEEAHAAIAILKDAAAEGAARDPCSIPRRVCVLIET